MRSSIILVCLFGVVLQALAQQQIFCVINTGSCLRIRSEASVSGQSLICVRDGTKLEDLNAQITADGIIWRNVKYLSYVGWTSKQYLKSCGTVPSSPISNLNDARPLTLLPLPTQRPIRQFYGDTRFARTNTAQFRPSQGLNPWLEFVADENDVVIASCGGQIVHAGDNSPFGAGRVSVIVRCGPWYVIYGRLKSTTVKRGDRAYLGQIIGRAGTEGLPLQVRQVPISLLRDDNVNNHPGDSTLAINPLTVFSSDFSSYFNSEFNRLGGRQQFCTGDLNSQSQIQFGATVRTDRCTN
jgi:hypothetical protein